MPARRAGQAAEAGLALAAVLMFMGLASLLILGAAHRVRLGELFAGQDADEAGAVLAAQALLADAERDVLSPRFLLQPADFQALQARLGGLDPPCEQGVCLSLGRESLGESDSFWWRAARLRAFAAQGVAYGRYTGAGAGGNPLLRVEPGRGAWYWVEVLPYQVGAAVVGGPRAAMTPLPSQPFVYRITALVQGRRAEARVVLQSLLVRQAIGEVE